MTDFVPIRILPGFISDLSSSVRRRLGLLRHSSLLPRFFQLRGDYQQLERGDAFSQNIAAPEAVRYIQQPVHGGRPKRDACERGVALVFGERRLCQDNIHD